MNLDEDYSKLEQLERLLKHPDTISPEELDAMMEDEEFVALYRTAMDSRRAMMGRHALPDVESAFDNFRNKEMLIDNDSDDTEQTGRRINFRLWISIAAAACVLLCVGFFFGGRFFNGNQENDLSKPIQVYAANNKSDEVVLSVGGKTIALANIADDSLSAIAQAKMHGTDELSYSEGKDAETNAVHTLSTPQGKSFQIVLADGTRVWLNAESQITYPATFTGATRTVQLKGEAYFEVAKDAEHPFVVETGGLNTTVLGTSFNVRNYAGEAAHVTLVNGSVKVSCPNNDVVLKPGYDASVDGHGSLVAKAVDVNPYISWKDGEFYFDGITFRSMLVDIGRWYGMNVVFNNAKHLDESLHMRADRSWSIQDIVKQINMISDTKVRLEGSTLVVE